MATGRTVSKWARVYLNGYDLTPYTGNIGPLTWEYEEGEFTALNDETKNVLPGHATITPGTLNGVFDNTANSGIQVLSGGLGTRKLMIPIGIRAAPAVGDEVFIVECEQVSYIGVEGSTLLTTTTNFMEYSGRADQLSYDKPWGKLLHAKGAETAANSATGAGVDNGAASTAGGYLAYQVFSGDGTATISIDDSADDSSYSALSGATTGSINCAVVQSGAVALGTTATVRRYLRWQIALGTATTVTFALAFVRG